MATLDVMVELRALPVDDPVASDLLAEYFGVRAADFPGHAYLPKTPDPAAFAPPDGVFVTVWDADSPVGCGGIRRIEDGALGIRYEVKHLYLRPETRGRGWGRVLLGDLERRAREWGAAELVLDTHHTLEAAGRLYASAGFTPIEPYNDNPNATVWLGKALRPRIPATITMRPTAAGGRHSPVGLRGEYRPHVRVRGADAYLGVVFFSDEGTELHPGQTVSTMLELIYDVDYTRLKPGAEFEVLEGSQVVGTGVVS